MKKTIGLFTAMILLLSLCACTTAQLEGPNSEVSQGPTWQEQYDLGVRYLSEGSYEEAILAFTAAIEIDPKQAPAYVGRGDAYVKFGETEDNLAAAKADYETAIELDETGAEAYLGLADVYLSMDDKDAAIAILELGYMTTNDKDILSRLEQIRDNKPDGASETITVRGHIIDNMEEYNEEIQKIRESYFTKEVDGTRYYNISSFGIRFDEPVNIVISGEYVSLVEVNFTFGNSEVFSAEAPVASVVNHKIRMTGYFFEHTQNGYIGCYWPNGDYCFAVTEYEEIE